MARRAELQRRERQAIAGDMILQRQQREEARRQEREEMRRRMEAWAKENEAVRLLEGASHRLACKTEVIHKPFTSSTITTGSDTRAGGGRGTLPPQR